MRPGNESCRRLLNRLANSWTPPPGRIYLRHAHDIRRELASVYRDMRNRKIDPQDGTRLAYVLDLIRKAYEASVLQERVEILERVLKLRNRSDEA